MARFHSPGATWLIALLTFPLLAASCGSGGGGSGTSAAVTFDGDWQGTWGGSSLYASGTLTLQLEQVGATVTGTATFQGHPCFTVCQVHCQVNGERISGSFDQEPLHMGFGGACSGDHHGPRHHHSSEMAGTYEIPGGPCAGERGQIQLTRVPASAPGTTGNGTVQIGEVLLIDVDEGEMVRLPVYRARPQHRSAGR